MSEEYPLAKRKKPLEGEVVGPNTFRDLYKSIAKGVVYVGSRGPLYRPVVRVDSTAKTIEPKEEA